MGGREKGEEGRERKGRNRGTQGEGEREGAGGREREGREDGTCNRQGG